jgi:MFS family permease
MKSRFGALWHNPNFLKLWMGETVSYIGSQITVLVLPLTAILFLKVNSAQLGVLNAMDYMPFLLFSLVAGIWIDRHHRRPILIIANIGRAVLLIFIPLLAWFGHLRFEYLLAITFLVGIFNVFFSLAYQSFLPSVVNREELTEGNSKLALSLSLSEVIGPGLGGLLLQIIAAPFALLVDACSFLISAFNLLLIHVHEPEPVHTRGMQNVWHDMKAGFKITFGNASLRAFAGEAAHYNLFWQMFLTVFLLYAIRILHISVLFLGILFALGSVGGLIGVLLTNYTARRFGVGPTITVAAMIGCMPPLLIPFIHGQGILQTSLLATAFLLTGAGVTGCNVHVISVRQALTPERFLGRMNSIYRLLTYGVIPIAALLSGFLGQWIGLHNTLLISTCGLALDFLWLLLSPIPRLRTLAFSIDSNAMSSESMVKSDYETDNKEVESPLTD